MRLIASVLLLGFPSLALAFSDLRTLQDARLDDSTGTEPTLTFYAESSVVDGKAVELARRKHIVHIRFRPRNLAHPATLEEHQAALKLLRELVAKEEPLTVVVMSGQGWRPIEKRPGHYRTDALRLFMHRGRQFVMFIHGDGGRLAGFYARAVERRTNRESDERAAVHLVGPLHARL